MEDTASQSEKEWRVTSPQQRKQAPARGRTGRRQGGDARADLLSVAVDLFAQHGYDGVSTGMIAAAAHISQPMVYYHFRNKDDLWQSAMTHLMRDLGRRYPLAEEDLKDLDPAAQLRLITRRFIRLSAGDPRLAQIVILESMARSERLDWLAQQYLRGGFGTFDEIAQRGIAAGQIKDLPLYMITNTLVAASSLTFCVSAQVEKIYDVDVCAPERFADISDSIVEILFNGLILRD